MKKHTLSSVFLAIIFFLLSSSVCCSPIFAGGGQWRPINFGHEQPISTLSYEFIIQVNDYSQLPAMPVVGKNFRFEAHHELAGADCQTTQGTSDSQGYIKGRCKVDQPGRFVFSISSQDGLGGIEFAVYLTGGTPATNPAKPTPQPSPIIKKVKINTSTAAAVVTTVDKASPAAEVVASPSQTPIVLPSKKTNVFKSFLVKLLTQLIAIID